VQRKLYGAARSVFQELSLELLLLLVLLLV
jgi:hypothetical protein